MMQPSIIISSFSPQYTHFVRSVRATICSILNSAKTTQTLPVVHID